MGGDIFPLFEEALVGIDGGVGQLDLVGVLDEGIGGLVKADVAVGSQAQQLQVRAAEGIDHGIIAGALGLSIGVHAVGDVAVGLIDVHMVEEVGTHKVSVALVVVLGQAHILVQVDGSDLGEVQIAALVLGNQLLVGTDGAAAGSQAQNAVGLQLNLSSNDIGSLTADVLVILGANQSHDKNPFLLYKFAIGAGLIPLFPIITPFAKSVYPIPAFFFINLNLSGPIFHNDSDTFFVARCCYNGSIRFREEGKMEKKRKLSTRKIVFTALMAALVFVGSALRVRLPIAVGSTTSFHLGNIFCALSGLLLGPWLGGLAAGLGSAIFDMFDPIYISEAWLTFLMKGIYGLLPGLIFRAGKKEGGYGKAVLGSAAGAVAYALAYLLKSYIKGIYIKGWEPAAAAVDVVAKLPATVFNAVVAIIFAPILFLAIRKALQRNHLSLDGSVPEN